MEDFRECTGSASTPGEELRFFQGGTKCYWQKMRSRSSTHCRPTNATEAKARIARSRAKEKQPEKELEEATTPREDRRRHGDKHGKQGRGRLKKAV